MDLPHDVADGEALLRRKQVLVWCCKVGAVSTSVLYHYLGVAAASCHVTTLSLPLGI